MLIVNNGLLIGANGITIDGNSYNVAFIDGTCAGVFVGCDQSRFAFMTSDSALAASNALLNDVLLDGPQGDFDSIPTLTVGCLAQGNTACGILTPYEVVGSGSSSSIRTWMAFNGALADPGTGPNHTGLRSADPDEDFIFGPHVWAVWTSVPEPSSLISLSFALLALASIWCRRTMRDTRFN